MRDILSPKQQPLLREIANANVLVVFDFDGTLVPIVEHPSAAEVPQATRDLLKKVAQTYPAAVISGRRRAEVRRLLRGMSFRYIVGNHGADLIKVPTNARRRVAQWRKSLQANLAGLKGVWVEDKGLSLTVHYRNSPQGLRARRSIAEAARTLEGARLTAAKKGLNVRLPSLPDKGDAIRILQRYTQCERVIFLGDDHTDEDVFSKDWNGTLLGVNVGRRKSSAHFQLRSQSDVDRFLSVLIRLREVPLKSPGGKSRARGQW